MSLRNLNSTFQLVESEKELLKLKDAVKPFLPRSTQIYNILQLKLQGRFTNENPTDFYVYEGNEQHCEPFIVGLQRPNIWTHYGIVVHAPSHLTEEMVEAFETLIDWETNDRMFISVDQGFFTNYLKPLCKKHTVILASESGLEAERNIMDMESLNNSKQEFSDSSEQSEEIELRPLSLCDVDKLVLHYPFCQEHSRAQIQLSIELYPSCGLYVKGVLASWAILSGAGILNILHTDESFRRRGFGVMVLKNLAKSVAEIGIIPIAENEPWNVASRKTQFKAGFKFVGFTNWAKLK